MMMSCDDDDDDDSKSLLRGQLATEYNALKAERTVIKDSTKTLP